jgi:tetratricopeptide (TPR) repeat protein
MTDHGAEFQALAGRRVAFTGRLASMSRRAAAEAVERHGGKVCSSVTCETSLLVVGREGWPVRPDGRLTRDLDRARHLQQTNRQFEILPEEQFLQLLQLGTIRNDDGRTCSIAELTELLDVPRSRIEAWQRAGLIASTECRDGIAYFDFQQVSATRSLHKLVAAGASPKRLSRSLGQLRRWLNFDIPNDELLPGLLTDGKRFLFRTDDGQLAETTGQLLFDFDEPGELLAFPCRQNPDATFEEAVRLEQAGEFAAAADCYRKLLLDDGPDAEVWFNLANVLHAMGETQAAIERFHDAVGLDPEFTDAWNNLANLLAHSGKLPEARRAYQRAVEVEPDYADAHYGLADVLELLGSFREAQFHWRRYLELEQEGQLADYARSRLDPQTA